MWTEDKVQHLDAQAIYRAVNRGNGYCTGARHGVVFDKSGTGEKKAGRSHPEGGADERIEIVR